MTDVTPTCARHPDVETRLRCSSCDTPICPGCGREAPVGFKCPDCATLAGADRASTGARGGRDGWLARLGERRPGPPTSGRGSPGPAEAPDAVSLGRAVAVGLAAAGAGGALLGPILVGGTLFLLSSGVIGWGVARSVFWAAEERSTPFLRAFALTMAGFSVALGLIVAGTSPAPANVLLLAYLGALYGGWIVVRRR